MISVYVLWVKYSAFYDLCNVFIGETVDICFFPADADDIPFTAAK